MTAKHGSPTNRGAFFLSSIFKNFSEYFQEALPLHRRIEFLQPPFDVRDINSWIFQDQNPDVLDVSGPSRKNFMKNEILEGGKADLLSAKENFISSFNSLRLIGGEREDEIHPDSCTFFEDG